MAVDSVRLLARRWLRNNRLQPTAAGAIMKAAAAEAATLLEAAELGSPKRVMDRDATLRDHLQGLLGWEDAHVNFDSAVEEVPPSFRGVVPKGLPYSLWQLIEHLRLTQRDILEFCRNAGYVEPSPEEYWPASSVPPTDTAWDMSVAAFRGDLNELKHLAADDSVDLFQPIPHGTGQTYLRELLLVADHNAYHVAQLVAVRRILGIWRAT